MPEGASPKIAVLGLGYVGLPLAVALAARFDVIGFDISELRIRELAEGRDRTGEVSDDRLRSTSLALTSNVEDLLGRDVFIVTVPTPVGADHEPDLDPLRRASEMVGGVLMEGATVVFESTVYPGVTEEFCGPILEEKSGLMSGSEFFLGYSPERINPGDREHTVDRITKVVAGQNEKTSALLERIYGAVNGGDVFVARNIRTAEASKVIENAQRDINIAFVNEISMIFSRIGVSIYDVLDAAGTKWNFLDFRPGMVGGHCIGVDPYYLAHLSRKVGHEPDMILAGREINEGMSAEIAARVVRRIGETCGPGPRRVLVFGLTFKENVPDLRNTKVVDMVRRIGEAGHDVQVHDPVVDPVDASDRYGIDVHTSLEGLAGFDCVIGAVGHSGYRDLSAHAFAHLLPDGGLVADIKRIWSHLELPAGIHYWTL